MISRNCIDIYRSTCTFIAATLAAAVVKLGIFIFNALARIERLSFSDCHPVGVENHRDAAIGNAVDDMRPPLRHLVDRFDRDTLLLKIQRSAAGRDDMEAQRRRFLTAGRITGLSLSFTETKIAPSRGRIVPAPSWDGVGGEIGIDAPSPRRSISSPGSAPDRRRGSARTETPLLHRDVRNAGDRSSQILELFARHHPRRDLRDRRADGLGDERHRAARARVDLDQVYFEFFSRPRPLAFTANWMSISPRTFKARASTSVCRSISAMTSAGRL